MVLIVGIVKGIFITAEQRLMRVHAAAVLTKDGLGHEGGIDPMLPGDLLDRDPEGQGFVGHLQTLVKA